MTEELEKNKPMDDPPASERESETGADRETLGKFLALILRHQPEAAGISLDCHGWADVDKLVAGVSLQHRFSREILEEIVATDSKGRYVFNEDRSMIRACQGHSIPVDLELQPVEPPEVLYHGTSDKSVRGILKRGIRSGSRQYVHLSPDVETAVGVGLRHGDPVVFRVDAGRMDRDGIRFFRSENGVWLTGTVAPEYIRQIDLPPAVSGANPAGELQRENPGEAPADN